MSTEASNKHTTYFPDIAGKLVTIDPSIIPAALISILTLNYVLSGDGELIKKPIFIEFAGPNFPPDFAE